MTFIYILGAIFILFLFYNSLIIGLKGGLIFLAGMFHLLLLGLLLPFELLGRWKWLWLVQLPLGGFYTIFLYMEGWGWVPFVLAINSICFVLIYNIGRLRGRSRL